MEAGFTVRYGFDSGLALTFKTLSERERAKLAFATADEEVQLAELRAQALRLYAVVKPVIDRISTVSDLATSIESACELLRIESAGWGLKDCSFKMLAVQCKVLAVQLRATLVTVDGWHGEGGPATVERFIEKASWDLLATAATAVGEILSGEFEKHAIPAALDTVH